MKILDGKKLAEEIKAELKTEISALKSKGIMPGLAVVLVGDNPASKIYTKNKEKTCQELGIFSEIITLRENTTEETLLKLINRLNGYKKIHGILVQLPLPKHISKQKIINAIDPKKDVDCFHPENIGKMFLGELSFLPCTPGGVIELLKRNGIKMEGKNAVIVGRSNIVGKPLAMLFLKENATVTICHSKTKNLRQKCQEAEILVVAVGRAGLIKANMVKRGAVVIDVGINRDKKGKLAGDVDFPKVSKIAGAITPVPGGVGPMTIVMLIKNTLKAAAQTALSN